MKSLQDFFSCRLTDDTFGVDEIPLCACAFFRPGRLEVGEEICWSLDKGCLSIGNKLRTKNLSMLKVNKF